MARRDKDETDDLTEKEIAFLRGSTVPEEVRHYLSRQHENLGTKSSAYRKVAAAARAERDALLEVRALQIVTGEASEASAARRQVEQLQRTNEALEGRLAAEQERITSLIARPALAVHSESSQR